MLAVALFPSAGKLHELTERGSDELGLPRRRGCGTFADHPVADPVLGGALGWDICLASPYWGLIGRVDESTRRFRSKGTILVETFGDRKRQ
jgi:hypothetical protein